jgi:hypothetical protein
VFVFQADQDSSFLHDENAPPAIQNEIKELLKADKPDTTRLFELFLQREDMHRLSSDFRELTALTGDPLENDDAISWSNFSIESDEELLKLRDAMMEAEREFLAQAGGGLKAFLANKKILKKAAQLDADKESGDEEESSSEDEVDIDNGFSERQDDDDDEGDDDVQVGEGQARVADFTKESTAIDDSLEDMVSVTDREGYVWSGLVINTDTTQTTLPSGRFLTHRCLVMVGNLKGAGGFGMGKGQNATDAMQRAFR